MGIPKNPPTVTAWMSPLSAMKAANIRVRRMCSSPCKFWIDEDLDTLIAQLGPDFSLMDQRPPCPVCDRLNSFMCSPRRGTPFRPMQTENRPQPKRPEGGWPVWPDGGRSSADFTSQDIDLPNQ